MNFFFLIPNIFKAFNRFLNLSKLKRVILTIIQAPKISRTRKIKCTPTSVSRIANWILSFEEKDYIATNHFNKTSNQSWLSSIVENYSDKKYSDPRNSIMGSQLRAPWIPSYHHSTTILSWRGGPCEGPHFDATFSSMQPYPHYHVSMRHIEGKRGGRGGTLHRGAKTSIHLLFNYHYSQTTEIHFESNFVRHNITPHLKNKDIRNINL